MSTHEEPYSDCTVSEAMALHTVVRAMHSGNCPKCTYMAPEKEFEKRRRRSPRNLALMDFECPSCGFAISHEETISAAIEYSAFDKLNVEMFEAWRKRRNSS